MRIGGIFIDTPIVRPSSVVLYSGRSTIVPSMIDNIRIYSIARVHNMYVLMTSVARATMSAQRHGIWIISLVWVQCALCSFTRLQIVENALNEWIAWCGHEYSLTWLHTYIGVRVTSRNYTSHVCWRVTISITLGCCVRRRCVLFVCTYMLASEDPLRIPVQTNVESLFMSCARATHLTIRHARTHVHNTNTQTHAKKTSLCKG